MGAESLLQVMGLFAVNVEVFSIRDVRKSRVLEFIVDTGATLSVVPADIAKELGAEPEEKAMFELANGERVARDIGHLGFSYEGRRRLLPVVIGEANDIPLLGAIALESLGYEADPVHKTLRPTTMYMMSVRTGSAAKAIGA